MLIVKIRLVRTSVHVKLDTLAMVKFAMVRTAKDNSVQNKLHYHILTIVNDFYLYNSSRLTASGWASQIYVRGGGGGGWEMG